MFAQTKRWGLDSKGKGRNRNLHFPLVAPLVPFRQSGKERKKDFNTKKLLKFTQKTDAIKLVVIRRIKNEQR